MNKPAFVPHSSGFWFHAETAPNVCDTLARLPRSHVCHARNVCDFSTVTHKPANHGQWQTAPATADGYAADVLHNGSIHARFKTRERAAKYCGFMRGERFNF